MYKKKFLRTMFNFGLVKLVLATMTTVAAFEQGAGAGAGPDPNPYVRMGPLSAGGAGCQPPVLDEDYQDSCCCFSWFSPKKYMEASEKNAPKIITHMEQQQKRRMIEAYGEDPLEDYDQRRAIDYPEPQARALQRTGPFGDMGKRSLKERYLRLSEHEQDEVNKIYHPSLIQALKTRLTELQLPLPIGPTYELTPGGEWSTSYQWLTYCTGSIQGKYDQYLLRGDTTRQSECGRLVAETNQLVNQIMRNTLDRLAPRPVDVAPRPVDTVIPAGIPRGVYEEEVYRRFVRGLLIYRSDAAGRIDMPIAAFANPLEGTFDLSKCDNAGQCLSISTGYRKRKNPVNADKVEIWFAPRFLIERELSTTAGHFREIIGKWDGARAPIGIFCTWGDWDDLGWYDYLTDRTLEEINSNDLYENCAART